MSGTVVTLRPNETYNQGAWWTVTGGPTTLHAATADDSDATYCATTGNPGFLGCTNLTSLPTGARIVSVTIRVRWQGDGTATGAVATVDNLTGAYAHHATATPVPATLTTRSFEAQTTRPGGGPWTADAVNNITVRIAGSAATIHFVEVYADVLYNERPVASGLTPVGTIDTQQPAISWDYDDPENDPQSAWQVRVFTAAVAGGGGFSAENSPAVADSGTSYYGASGATSWTVPTPLSPGIYHTYVRVSDLGSDGRWSDWASAVFTVVGDPPAPPALLSVVPDPARGRVEIRVRQSDNLLGQRTATADGDPLEHVRWYNQGNVTNPTTTTGGIDGDCHTATVVADGEAAIFGLTRLTAVPGVDHIWAGWIKSDLTSGVMHLDAAWFSGSGSFLRLDEGGYIGLNTTYQASEGRARPPDGAVGVYLLWRSAGDLAADQALFWDDNGIWPTRQDADLDDELAALEARIRAAEDAIVDHEIRIAALEGVPPNITIQQSGAPIDATAYRGGLDSSNLLGPRDATAIWTIADTHWTVAGVGSLASALDLDAFDFYSFQYAPTVAGSAHAMRLDYHYPIPHPTARYQFSFRHRAVGIGLTADAYLIWTDGDAAPVGAPVGVGRVTLTESATFSAPEHVSAVPPAGATKFTLHFDLSGDTETTDRWIFDRLQVARMPLVPPELGFGLGGFGYGPFGGTTADHEPALAFKPASQCDVYPLIESSVDGGDTWVPVRLTERAAYDPITRVAVVRDYEARLGAPTLYRARTAARDYQTNPISGALIVSAPTTTRETTLTVDGWHVVDPYTQVRLPFEPVGSPPELAMTTPRPQTQFSPLGRDHKILLSDRAKGGEFDWTITLADAAAWDALEALLRTGHTLLVQTPIGRSWYIQVGDAWQLGAVLEGTVDHGATVRFVGYEQARPA